MREWRAEIDRRLRGARLDGATERDIADELAQLGRTTPGEWLGGWWWSDVRFGARMLARAPLYATTAVLVIALGIGANTWNSRFLTRDVAILDQVGKGRQFHVTQLIAPPLSSG
jgi:hypothetical protein